MAKKTAKAKKKAALKHNPDLRPGKGAVFPEERLEDMIAIKAVLDRLGDSTEQTLVFLANEYGPPIESTTRFGTKFLAAVQVDGKGEEFRVCVVHREKKNKDETISIEVRKWYDPGE